ncbi:MAG: NUDIX domain-containing protein [Robiginitomaculum sp.]
MINVLNPSNHANPILAVDLGLICIDEGVLKVLLMARDDYAEVGGAWALPGGIVHIDETLNQTATRVLKTKAKLDQFHLEQLETFGELNRDPRGRVVSVAYFALTPHVQRLKEATEHDDLTLAVINLSAKVGDQTVSVLSENGQNLGLAFDHDIIINRIITRLKGKLDYTPIALSLLPEHFTLREVQQVFETIQATSFAKPAFRRKVLDRNIFHPTGLLETASNFRPAELYKRL